jgi:hypothetical protein
MMAKLAELGVQALCGGAALYTDDRAGCWEEDLRRTASLICAAHGRKER